VKNISIFTAAALALAGCGTGTQTPLATTQSIGTLPSGLVATSAPSNVVVLTIDGTEVATFFDGGSFNGRFRLHTSGDQRILRADAPSGQGEVLVISSPTSDLGLAGVQFRRDVETELPSGGSATYFGAYASFIVNSDLEFFGAVDGNFELTADFANASISGQITNRVGIGFTATDVVLAPTAITSAGAFSGATTGGSIVGQTVSSGGNYSGLIVGNNGTDVVGGLVVSHQFGLDQLSEIGGFAGEE